MSAQGAVVVEVRGSDGWGQIGVIVGATGSITSMEPVGRQIYVFGFIDNEYGIWRSLGGVDEERGAFRILDTVGLERLADLSAGPYEMGIVSPRAGPLRVRFTLRSPS